MFEIFVATISHTAVGNPFRGLGTILTMATNIQIGNPIFDAMRKKGYVVLYLHFSIYHLYEEYSMSLLPTVTYSFLVY